MTRILFTRILTVSDCSVSFFPFFLSKSVVWGDGWRERGLLSIRRASENVGVPLRGRRLMFCV